MRLWAYVRNWDTHNQASFHQLHRDLIGEVLMLWECLPNPSQFPADQLEDFMESLIAELTSPGLQELTASTLVGIVQASIEEAKR